MRTASLLASASFALAVLSRAAAVEAPAPLPPVPSAAQLAWQRMELTMFLHFGVNTFTDREWGDGREEPKIFNPTGLDARQWVRTAKAAGFKLIILTAKHHDGFCLWPSAFTEHSVKNSPWKDGKGDVMREFTDACRAGGMKIGVYLSPWDRNSKLYGTDEYNVYFKNQLGELLGHYGRIDEVWFDGACGEGPNGKKQVYDFPGYYEVIRRRQPGAVIAIMGPDIRWVGNESGVARTGESSVQAARGGPHAGATGNVWYPAECDVSIRPGWFYHASEDAKVKSMDHLLDIYFKSVGRNSVLLLNVPPDRRGLLSDADVQRLQEFSAELGALYATNRAAGAKVSASHRRGGAAGDFAPEYATDGELDSYWSTDDGVLSNAWLEVDFGAPKTFNLVDVREFIPLGERVRAYRIEADAGDGLWREAARGTIVGHRNLHRLPRTTARRVRLTIDAAAACPAIAGFGVFDAPRDFVSPASGSVAAHKPATASNVHGGGTQFGGDKAVDDDPETRWATADETRACTLDVDLQKPERIGRLSIAELEPRITKFELQYRAPDGTEWKTAYSGGKAGKKFEASFPPVEAREVRLNILDASFAPTIWEFRVFPPK